MKWLLALAVLGVALSGFNFAISADACLPNQDCYKKVEDARGWKIFWAQVFGGADGVWADVQSEKILELRLLSDAGVKRDDVVFVKQVDAIQKIQVARKPLGKPVQMLSPQDRARAAGDVIVLEAIALPSLNNVLDEKRIAASGGVVRVA